MGNLISIVVPAYNEEKNIPVLAERAIAVVSAAGCDCEIIFAMDPCTDSTERVILDMRKTDPRIKLIKMSRRFGQPACALAGIYYCSGDACVIIDSDLQDPPEVIAAMIEKWRAGYDVVHAQRTSREGENFIKRFVAYWAYWIIDKVAEVEIPRNTGDFRLISRRVIEHLREFKEHDGFLRGLVAYVGFNQVSVQYERSARLFGQGNYNRFLGSMRIGLNGILGFSKYPLHLIALAGLIVSSAALIGGLAYLAKTILSGAQIQWGNAALFFLISFLGGIQLLSLGIIGEYIARTFDGIKQRPVFIVQEAHGFTGTLRR